MLVVQRVFRAKRTNLHEKYDYPNQMAVQYHTAVIVVTHDEKIIPTFKRIYHIRDGRTEEEAGQGLSL